MLHRQRGLSAIRQHQQVNIHLHPEEALQVVHAPEPAAAAEDG
jgi:hypothetical protein